jgi:hypothetical protein
MIVVSTTLNIFKSLHAGPRSGLGWVLAWVCWFN